MESRVAGVVIFDIFGMYEMQYEGIEVGQIKISLQLTAQLRRLSFIMIASA